MWPPDQSPSGSILALIQQWQREPRFCPTRPDTGGLSQRSGGWAPLWSRNGDWHVHMASVEFGQPVEKRSGDHYCVGSDGLHEMPRTDEVQSVR